MHNGSVMAKIGIGLIGCGARLRVVVRELFKATDQVEIVAIQDPNPHSIEAARQEFNSEARVYETYEELLRDPAAQWVMIGSWNSHHAGQAIAAFEAGKHVFCEKPLALSVDDCLAMRKAWKAAGTQFSIGFTLRYSPHYRRIKEILASGRIGAIVSMEFNETLDFNHGGYIHADWRRKTQWAGSHLLEKCCHDLDLVNWMTESLAIKAASFGGCDFFTPANAHHMARLGKSADGRDAYCTWNDPTIEGNIVNPFNADKDILDNQVAILQFANGVRLPHELLHGYSGASHVYLRHRRHVAGGCHIRPVGGQAYRVRHHAGGCTKRCLRRAWRGGFDSRREPGGEHRARRCAADLAGGRAARRVHGVCDG